MVFKSFIGAVGVCLTVASLNTNAFPTGITDNGDYTSQTVGSTTIDWLDLTFTANTSYDDALAVAGSVSGGGWSYASASQVESLLDTLFAGIAYNSFGYASVVDSVYAPEFISLFGVTFADPSSEFSYGLYDDSGVLGMGGVLNATGTGTADLIYGPDYTGVYARDGANPAIGTYLVRSSTRVGAPEPSIAILMVSGLVAFGVMRRKKRM